MPRISIVMPSYNHARFIGESIRSILDQTMDEVELVIVDDGSKDHSSDVVQSFSDRRIVYIPLSYNVGACAAMNIAIERCTSELIAVCHSDDLWEPDKLEKQTCILESMPHVGAVFTNVTWIDDRSEMLAEESQPMFRDVFEQPNRSRHAWLRRLVEGGNCLCHPSVLIRKQVYKDVGLYNNYLRQQPDFDMWIRVVQRYEIAVMHDRLVRFRIHDSNTSQDNNDTIRRTWREDALIFDDFFRAVTPDNFLRAFGSHKLQSLSSNEHHDFEAEKIAYLLQYSGMFEALFRELALRRLYERRDDWSTAESALAFQRLSASCPAPNERTSKDEELDRLRQLVQELQLAEVRLNSEVQHLNSEVQHLTSELGSAKSQIDQYLRSTSWRVTSPMRGLARLLGRGRRNSKNA